jgi:hypothetical protein
MHVPQILSLDSPWTSKHRVGKRLQVHVEAFHWGSLLGCTTSANHQKKYFGISLILNQLRSRAVKKIHFFANINY